MLQAVYSLTPPTVSDALPAGAGPEGTVYSVTPPPVSGALPARAGPEGAPRCAFERHDPFHLLQLQENAGDRLLRVQAAEQS